MLVTRHRCVHVCMHVHFTRHRGPCSPQFTCSILGLLPSAGPIALQAWRHSPPPPPPVFTVTNSACLLTPGEHNMKMCTDTQDFCPSCIGGGSPDLSILIPNSLYSHPSPAQPCRHLDSTPFPPDLQSSRDPCGLSSMVSLLTRACHSLSEVPQILSSRALFPARCLTCCL